MPEQSSWTGSVWGPTAKGTVAAEMTKDGNRLSGSFVLFEPGLGQLQAHLVGEWSDTGKVTATLDQFTATYSVPVTLPRTGALDGTFEPTEGVIAGQWNTDSPAAGKFLLVKVEAQQPKHSVLPLGEATPAVAPVASGGEAKPAVPAFVTKTVVLGSYRLEEGDLRRLADLIRSGTNVLKSAINASHKGSEHIHIGVDSLLADASVPAVVYNVLVSANEPAVQVGTRTVTLNLKENDRNTLFVSGYDQVWVEGKAAQIEAFLQEHESKATHILRNYGSSLNGAIFLAMLAFLPSIPSLGKRLIVVAFVFGLLLLLMYSRRLAANTKVFLREAKFAWYERHAGWLLVLLEVGLSAYVGYLIKHFISAR
jgi:hypothetical protein